MEPLALNKISQYGLIRLCFDMLGIRVPKFIKDEKP